METVSERNGGMENRSSEQMFCRIAVLEPFYYNAKVDAYVVNKVPGEFRNNGEQLGKYVMKELARAAKHFELFEFWSGKYTVPSIPSESEYVLVFLNAAKNRLESKRKCINATNKLLHTLEGKLNGVTWDNVTTKGDAEYLDEVDNCKRDIIIMTKEVAALEVKARKEGSDRYNMNNNALVQLRIREAAFLKVVKQITVHHYPAIDVLLNGNPTMRDVYLILERYLRNPHTSSVANSSALSPGQLVSRMRVTFEETPTVIVTLATTAKSAVTVVESKSVVQQPPRMVWDTQACAHVKGNRSVLSIGRALQVDERSETGYVIFSPTTAVQFRNTPQLDRQIKRMVEEAERSSNLEGGAKQKGGVYVPDLLRNGRALQANRHGVSAYAIFSSTGAVRIRATSQVEVMMQRVIEEAKSHVKGRN